LLPFSPPPAQVQFLILLRNEQEKVWRWENGSEENSKVKGSWGQ
jgi:hypothetical protein